MGKIRVIAGQEIQLHRIVEASGEFEEVKVLENLSNTVNRLIGRPLGAFGVTKGLYECMNCSESEISLHIQFLKRGTAVALITFDFEIINKSSFDTLTSDIKKDLQKRLKDHYSVPADNSNTVYPVIAVIDGESNSKLESKDGLLVVKKVSSRIGFTTEILRQLVLRTAVERSILNWATCRKSSWFGKLFRASINGYTVNRWTVAPLADSIDIVEYSEYLRNTFNLEPVRREILDRYRTWWTTAAVTTGLAGIILSLILNLFKA